MKVITVGNGQVGCYLASLLTEREHEVTIIEAKGDRIEVLKKSLPHDTVLQGNGAEPRVLKTAGIRQVNVVAVVTGSDENNLVVGTPARLEYDMRRVINHVDSPKNAQLFAPLMSVGAAMNQADLMVRLVAEEMPMGDIMTPLKLHGGEYSLIGRIVNPGSSIQGKLLRDIELPTECVLVAIIRNSDLLTPRGETMLQGGDKVVTIIHIDQLENMERTLGAGV